MNVKKIKTTHGGKRPGAGAKKIDNPKKQFSTRIDLNILNWLYTKKDTPGGMAGMIERGLLMIMDAEKK